MRPVDVKINAVMAKKKDVAESGKLTNEIHIEMPFGEEFYKQNFTLSKIAYLNLGIQRGTLFR